MKTCAMLACAPRVMAEYSHCRISAPVDEREADGDGPALGGVAR